MLYQNTRESRPIRPGLVHLDYGPMRSRKTAEAITAAEREALARGIALTDVVYLKPSRDTRDSDVRSLSGIARSCVLLPDTAHQAEQDLQEHLKKPNAVIVLDEGHFLPLVRRSDGRRASLNLIAQARRYRDLFINAAARGSAIFIAQLDADYTRIPFPFSEALLLDPRVHKTARTAVCVRCGRPATLTQCLYELRPAPRSMPTILPEGENDRISYEPRCFVCHELPD